MKQITVLIKPASSLCNMRCAYCFYSDVSASRENPSFGIMKKETAETIIEHIFIDLAPGDAITFAFQGGEPTLAGLDFFKFFTAAVDKRSAGVKVNYALQTNGLLLNEEFTGFLKDSGFLTGLSLDGPAALHNQNRADAGGGGTFGKVIRAKRLLDAIKAPYNVLAALTL